MSRLFAFAVPVLLIASLGCLRQAEEKVAPREPAVAIQPADPVITTRVEGAEDGEGQLPLAPFPHEPVDINLTNEDPGIETVLPELDRLGPQPPQLVDPSATIEPAKFDDTPAKPSASAFKGRSGDTKEALLKRYGGNEASEKA